MKNEEAVAASIHNKAYPDVPVWMRITDMPRKDNANPAAAIHGSEPPNQKICWAELKEEISAMIESDVPIAAIGRAISGRDGIPRQKVMEYCWRLVHSGEMVPTRREK